MRIFLGFLIAGVALGAAVLLHQWKTETAERTRTRTSDSTAAILRVPPG